MSRHDHHCPDCGRVFGCDLVDCGPRFDSDAVASLSCPACGVDDPGQDLRSPVREALWPGGYRALAAEGC